MKKLVFLCIFFSYHLITNAQFVEKFTDGNIQEAPEWLGDTSTYTVNASLELQLQDTIANNSFIYTPVSTGDSSSWEIYFRLDFNPSNQNQLKIYLASDAPDFADFSGNFNGYFLVLGENNSNDQIELFRQDGTSTNSTAILSSPEGSVAIGPEVRLRVTRNASGNWTLWTDYTGGNNFVLQDTGFDDTYPVGQYFGIGCKYSGGNSKGFFFDDIEIGPLYVDDDGPLLLSATPINENQVDLVFNEALDQASAENSSNYSIDNGINVLTSELDPNLTVVHLTVTPLVSGQNYLANITNVKDTVDNVMETTSLPFQFIKIEIPNTYDILINEIYADLAPLVGLPAGKFVELYNRSDRYFNLNNYSFADGASSTVLPDYILAPKSYVILCEDNLVATYSTFGPTIGLDNFPEPNITSDDLSLRNTAGEILHSVAYKNTWFQDLVKRQGGWSLELVNPNLFCLGAENWRDSNDPSGGTPGKQNSIFIDIPDLTAPELVSATAANDQQVFLVFSEIMDASSVSFVGNYNLQPAIGTAFSAELQADQITVLLTYSNAFTNLTNYTISVNNLRDCQGNFIASENSTDFTYYKTEPAERYDLIINEIFANPSPSLGLPEKEFVELYNRSDKNINLENYSFDKGSGNPVALPFHILLPDEYVILEKINVFTNFGDFGENLMLTSFGPINNSGDTLRIIDPTGETIDAVPFLHTWHEAGKTEGGFSLERINPQSPCRIGNQNWKSSTADLGATPGSKNSVFDDSTIDDMGPELIKAYVNRNVPDVLYLFFTEGLDEQSATDPNLYSFNSSDFTIDDIELEAPLFNSVRIQLSQAIGTEIYEVQINDALSDCLGNSFGAANTARFALSEEVEPLDVIINEALYNPGVGGSRFVEIYNRSDKVIDVIDLLLAKRNELGNISFPEVPQEACLLLPDDYLVLTPSPEDILSRYTAQNPTAFLKMTLPSYDDQEGNIILLTEASVIVDELSYNPDFHNELINDFNGVSLERINPNGATQSDANWHSAAAAVGFATPTYQNSQFVVSTNPSNQIIDIPTKTISPDDDGFQDVLLIQYEADRVGYIANFNIYDAKGRLVKNLVKNEVLGVSGSLKWDGTNNDQEKARIGIYIVWGELIHADGTVIPIKESIVVAGRFE